MKLQVLQDSNGNDSGVFIPMEEWILIKKNYPDVDKIKDELPDWQKEILDSRLKDYELNPNLAEPIETLFDELDREV